MTRKDYEAIAAAIADARKFTDHTEMTAGADKVAQAVADVMARDNPRFDRARFLKACGVSE